MAAPSDQGSASSEAAPPRRRWLARRPSDLLCPLRHPSVSPDRPANALLPGSKARNPLGAARLRTGPAVDQRLEPLHGGARELRIAAAARMNASGPYLQGVAAALWALCRTAGSILDAARADS